MSLFMHSIFPADLFGRDIFKVLAHHDTPEFGFD